MSPHMVPYQQIDGLTFHKLVISCQVSLFTSTSAVHRFSRFLDYLDLLLLLLLLLLVVAVVVVAVVVVVVVVLMQICV